MTYLGNLTPSDSLHAYFVAEIAPLLGIDPANADFHVFGIEASNPVRLFEESTSGVRFIGKYFGGVAGRTPEVALQRMEREFNSLETIRSLGLDGHPHYIPRPLGCSHEHNFLLTEEYCEGTPLDAYIGAAIHFGMDDEFFQKLSALGYFLAHLHNSSQTDQKVEFQHYCSYFNRVVERLDDAGFVDGEDIREFHGFRDQWREKVCMWEDDQVIIHGDMTPSNILFGDDLSVIAIDLERSRLGDRIFDVGRMAAEIKHSIMQHFGESHLAEPFIEHLLREYASHFPDPDAAFSSITNRVPFHMSVTLLRIARNDWISEHHRRQLIDEAKNTLR